MLLPVPFCKTPYTIPNEALTAFLTDIDDDTPVKYWEPVPINKLELLFATKVGVTDNPFFKILSIVPNDELTLPVK